uniref:ATP synthase complex subunit 8 n=1 Tax=Catopsilia pomona TaxID=320267 RepID=A0A059P8V6_9NEOP|nr:ATP synthase F0 subunit 8 [Catopsilia pomona]AFP58834.1 ATP synthase F0 subunit 8 [Catopsilia pomona]
MPQMMPNNWIIYFIFFWIIFMMFNIMNLYIYYNIKNNKLLKINLKKKLPNWKW